MEGAEHHWAAFPSPSQWVSFADVAVFWVPPPTTFLLCMGGDVEWTDGLRVQSITALTSVLTRRTPQNNCMSLSLENDLLSHSASEN